MKTRHGLMTAVLQERAAAVFAERGFATATLQDVAEAMGMTRPALYHYIESKDDLLVQLVDGLSKNTAASLKRIRQQDLTPREMMRAAVVDMVFRIADSPNRFRLLIMSEGDLPAAAAGEHQRARRQVLDHLRAIVRDGVHTGDFRPLDERVATFAVLGMCNWVAWWYQADHELTPAQVATSMGELLVSGLAVPGEAAALTPATLIERISSDLDLLARIVPRD